MKENYAVISCDISKNVLGNFDLSYMWGIGHKYITLILKKNERYSILVQDLTKLRSKNIADIEIQDPECERYGKPLEKFDSIQKPTL